MATTTAVTAPTSPSGELVLPEPVRERKSPMPPVPSGETMAGLLVKRMHRVVSNLNAPGTSEMMKLLAAELCAQKSPAMLQAWISHDSNPDISERRMAKEIREAVNEAVREGVRLGRLMQLEDQATLARLLVRRLPNHRDELDLIL